jgi:hypothetical protein
MPRYIANCKGIGAMPPDGRAWEPDLLLADTL